jgi:hypothetical protein
VRKEEPALPKRLQLLQRNSQTHQKRGQPVPLGPCPHAAPSHHSQVLHLRHVGRCHKLLLQDLRGTNGGSMSYGDGPRAPARTPACPSVEHYHQLTTDAVMAPRISSLLLAKQPCIEIYFCNTQMKTNYNIRLKHLDHTLATYATCK